MGGELGNREEGVTSRLVEQGAPVQPGHSWAEIDAGGGEEVVLVERVGVVAPHHQAQPFQT